MGSRTNSGPHSYFPGDLQIVNATIVNTTTVGDATGTTDPGALPAGNAGAPADNDRNQFNSALQIGTAAQNRRLSVFGPVFLAGPVTFTKGAADVITIDGRTTPHTALDDFRENFTRGVAVAGAQRASYFDVRSGGQLTVATDSLAAIRAEIAGAAGDVAPGGGAVRPNLVGVHIVMPDVAPAGAARRTGVLIDGSGADGIGFTPAIAFFPDNAHDVGLALADAIGGSRLRPRSIYAGTSVVVGASTTITTDTITIGVGAAAGIVETSRTTDAAGQNLTIRASAGFAGGVVSNAGGTLALNGGNAAAGTAGAAVGGNVTIASGNGAVVGATAGGGGTITLTAGTSAAGAGASVAGANITITAAAGASGAGGGAGVGGQVTLAGGAGAANGASTGGDINLTAGAGGGTGRGGDVVYTSGAGAGGSRRGVFRPGVDDQDDLGVNAAGGFRWRRVELSGFLNIWAVLGDVNPRTRIGVGSIAFGAGGAGVLDVQIARNGGAGLVSITANAAGATTLQIGDTADAASAAVVESVNNTMTLRSRRVAAGAGNGLLLDAGDGVTDGAGAATDITGGTAARTAAGASVGGNVSLTGGNAAAAGGVAAGAQGGSIAITAGNGAQVASGNGLGGDASIDGGTGVGIGVGGRVIIRAGAGGTVAPARGGHVEVTTGAAGAASAGQGGDLILTTGAGDGAGRRGVFRPGVDNQDDIGLAGAAGFRWRDIHITRDIAWGAAGAAVDVGVTRGGANNLLIYRGSGIGAGAVTVQVGTTGQTGTIESVDAAHTIRSRRAAAGAGNNMVLTSGTAVTDGAGGAINLTAGNATRTAAGPFIGGAIAIVAGNGAGAAASAATGGGLTLTAGNGGAGSDGGGGDIIIQPGDLAGAGANGLVRFRNAANSRTPDLLPRVDTEGNVGTAATRWALVRAVTITSGAYKEEETFKEESFAPEELLQALAKELDEYDNEGLRNMAKVAMFTGQLVRKKMTDFEQRILALERRLN